MISIKKYEKGFTLVELLAVIVILAIVLAIAIPGISTIIGSSKKGATESNAKILLKAIEYKMLETDDFDPTTITEDNVEEVLGIDASNYLRLTVKKMNGQIYITMVGKEKWDGITISGTKKNIRVDNAITTSEEVANVPVLSEGMMPVYYDEAEDRWEKADSNNVNNNWYQYGTTEATRRWANAVTVNASGTETGIDGVMRHDRTWYQSQPSGTPISISDINTMWVWIPRYVYKISSGWHREGLTAGQAGTIDIQFSKGVDDSWHSAIDLRETAYASKSTGLNNNGDKYTNHPAFTFGDMELTGIWVAKFEASAPITSSCYKTPNLSTCNSSNISPLFVPNVNSWRSIRIGNMFTASRKMETNGIYGWGTSGADIDTHMIKNIEWGAVAYLSKSIYGKNDEIWINPANDYTTGCAGGNISVTATTGCENKYDTPNGVQASTTGNIYGIYDMSGGAHEYLAAHLNNTSNYLKSYGPSIVNASSQYKDVYSTGVPDNKANNYDLAINKKGDAMYETSTKPASGIWTTSWYSDYTSIASENPAWFSRGGAYDKTTSSGIFAFEGAYGYEDGGFGFRAVLLVQSGL